MAVAYTNFTNGSQIYSTLSQSLILAAGINSGERVLDIGCGNGETTRQLLKAVGPYGEVVAVDQSNAMLNEAKRRVDAPNVRWYCLRAEEVGTMNAGLYDAVVASMVIWQTDLVATLSGVHSLMSNKGRLAFNIGTWYELSSQCDASKVARWWANNIESHDFCVTKLTHQEYVLDRSTELEWCRMALNGSGGVSDSSWSTENQATKKLCAVNVVSTLSEMKKRTSN
jgi:trans-aconitate methyltransferase